MNLTTTISRPFRPMLSSLLALTLAAVASTAAIAGDHAHGNAAATIVHSMLGTWDVKEWMWPAPGGAAVPLPSAVAQRRLVGDDFIQEVMNATPGSAGDSIDLLGSTFVAPQWGKFTNSAFRYRLVVGPVQDDRQEVVLYLTPLSGAGQPEFRAFRYVYTRRR